MKSKHLNLEIPESNPFANCRLDRYKYAEILTAITTQYSDGFVMAVNGEWGTGKTTFLKMWKQHLTNLEYKTLYFNAWENDFDKNALVAIMAELKVLSNHTNSRLYHSLLKKGAILSKNIVPALLKALVGVYVNKEIIKDTIENIGKAATEILQDEIKEYTSKKESLIEFRHRLKDFVEKVEGKKPIFFFIDELDRCRPDYAVEVLEQIKHFFSIEGIVFILGVDKNQLSNAVRGAYGSEQINAEEYLRRFIDIEFILPEPNIEKLCEYFFEFFDLQSFFLNTERLKDRGYFGDEKDALITTISTLSTDAGLSLRQLEKIFAHTRMVLLQFNKNNYTMPALLIMLVFLRTFDINLYKSLKYKKIKISDVPLHIEKYFPKNLDKYSSRRFIHLEAALIHFYANSIERGQGNSLYSTNADGTEIYHVKSNFDDADNNLFKTFLSDFRKNHSLNDIELKFLMERIDLTSKIIS